MVLVSWISKKQNMKENRFDVCKGRPDFLNHLYILNRPFFNTKNWLFSLMLKVIKMFGFFKINNVTLVAFGLSAISFGKHCLILTWNIDRVINVKSFENSYPCHEYNFKVTPSKAKLHLMASKNSSIKKYVKSNQSIEKQPHIIVALIKHRNQPHFYSRFGYYLPLVCLLWFWWFAVLMSLMMMACVTNMLTNNIVPAFIICQTSFRRCRWNLLLQANIFWKKNFS